MSHIFLSYSAEDRERVRPLVSLLGDVAPVWWDQAVRHGENWEIAVETAVEQAACVVVAWTQESVKSRWVRSEAGEGRKRSILIPVLFDDIEPPLAYRHIQTAQLQGWDGDPRHPQAQALKAAVADLMARGATSSQAAPPPELRTPAPPPPSAAPPSRRGARWLRTPGARVALAAVGAVIVVAAALGGYRLVRPSPVVIRADVTPSPVGSPAPSATAAPTPTPTAVASPTTTVRSLMKAVPSPTMAVSPPTMAVPSPTTAIGPSTTAVPSLAILPEEPPAQILVRDIGDGSPLEAVETQRFHYTVSGAGRIFAGARRENDGPISIGVATTTVGSTRRLGQTELANLVGLLTTLAHDHELDLRRVDFEDVEALSIAKWDIVIDAQELLAKWRASGVRPGKAAVSILRIATKP